MYCSNYLTLSVLLNITVFWKVRLARGNFTDWTSPPTTLKFIAINDQTLKDAINRTDRMIGSPSVVLPRVGMKLPSWEMSRAKLRRCRGLEASRVGGVSTPAPSISTSKRSMTGLTRRRPATSLVPSPRRRNNQTGPSLNNGRSYVNLFPRRKFDYGKKKARTTCNC